MISARHATPSSGLVIGMRRRTQLRTFDAHGPRFITHFYRSTANACYKDAADLHADLNEYQQAIARYELVADHSLGSALTKYSVKEYWLRAGLCALAMGVSSILHNGATFVPNRR